MAFLKALFGDYSTKEIKRIRPLCDKVLALEETYAEMSEDELRGQTAIRGQRLSRHGPILIPGRIILGLIREYLMKQIPRTRLNWWDFTVGRVNC